MTSKKPSLGRGLDKLIPPKDLDKIIPSANTENLGQPLMLDIQSIAANPQQPRQEFNEKQLRSLAESIKAKGIIEPLVVSRSENGFELISGERRLKAAQLANLKQVPVIIKKLTDNPSEKLILALLENLCREDLNPIEEALSFQKLEKEFGYTHQEIASMSGRERPTITNAVRLLRLPDYIQDDIRFGRLSAGHGRAMLALTDSSLYQSLRAELISKNISVRQTELMVKKLNRKQSLRKNQSGDAAYFELLANNFSQSLDGLKVRIIHSSKSKKLEIHYQTNEDLELLMTKFGVKAVL